MPSPTHRHLNQSKPCVCSCRRHIFNKRAGRRTTAVRRVPPFVAHQHPTTSSRAHRACVLTTAATVACMRLAADRARQQPAETPYALVGRIRGSVVPSCRLAPPPVSPVPRHAITSFRAHRLAPPQTTRNCASRPKYRALPKARQDKCCVPQLPNFKPRWRRISTRQLPKHYPRQGKCSCCAWQHTNFNAAHKSTAMPPRSRPSCTRDKALPKARKVHVLRLQVTLATDLHTPADRTTA